MGCDIHLYYEVKNGEKWELHNWEKEVQNGTYEDGSPRTDWDKAFQHPLYVGRNYCLFSVLADVRNGRGFAGVKTGDGFIPISEPKGIPSDVSPEVFAAYERWEGDGHSHSWFMLSDLLKNEHYDKTTVRQGIVNPEEYAVFKKNGKPDSWCGGVSGGRVSMLTPEMMELVIDNPAAGDPEASYYTIVHWGESYRSAIGEHWFRTLSKLEEMFGADNVRLVFWFDN